MNLLKILIVEDNELNIKYLELLMKKWGCQYKIAKNGEEAIHCCLEEKFDIILMDINMPVKNGFEATIGIRNIDTSKNIDSCIIAVSADDVNDQLEKAKTVGMNAFLSKPVSADDIMSVIKDYFFCKTKKTN